MHNPITRKGKFEIVLTNLLNTDITTQFYMKHINFIIIEFGLFIYSWVINEDALCLFVLTYELFQSTDTFP